MDEVDSGPIWRRRDGQDIWTNHNTGITQTALSTAGHAYSSHTMVTSTVQSDCYSGTMAGNTETYSGSSSNVSISSKPSSNQSNKSFSHRSSSNFDTTLAPLAVFDDESFALPHHQGHRPMHEGLRPGVQVKSVSHEQRSHPERETTTCTSIKSPELALLLKAGLEKYLLIDSRSFLEYNTSHIQQSANVCCSKLVKRRLQRDKVHIRDLLTQTCHIDIDEFVDVIVYDQCTERPELLTEDTFLSVLLQKLAATFKRVALLQGGFLAFQAMYPSLCENKTNSYRCAALTSLSQPCLPVSNVGPTRILPFLYLGSQQDALSPDIVQVNEITYVLNVSTTCIKPPHISDGHFLRVPVNDNYSAKLQPYFKDAFQFLDKVREANGCCLVHCLAGISRSPTLAIAYIMTHLNMSSDDAYRYVKDKRPTISPNFNFLGQLLEYEKERKRELAMNNNNSDICTIQKTETRLWSNYVMDLSSHSPSSPVAKNMRPFVFESTLSQGVSSSARNNTIENKKDRTESVLSSKHDQNPSTSMTTVGDREFKEFSFSRKFEVKSNHSHISSERDVSLSIQSSPFPISKESSVRPNVLNLGFDTSRRVQNTLNREKTISMSKSLTDIKEASETPSPSLGTDLQQNVLTTSAITFDTRNVKPLLSPFPCGESTISNRMLTTDQNITSSTNNSNSGSVYTMERTNNCVPYLSTKHIPNKTNCYSNISNPSVLESKVTKNPPQSPLTPSDNSPFSFSETFLKSRGKRPLRNSLSLSLSPITPTRPTPPLFTSGHTVMASSSPDKYAPSACKIERKVNAEPTPFLSNPNIPSPVAPQTSLMSTSLSTSNSVTTSHGIKLKSFSFSSSSSLTLPAQSPTSSLARLHFDSEETSDCEKDNEMDTSYTESKTPLQDHMALNRRAFSEPPDKDVNFYSFPSTSLNKLSFTPCLSNSTENVQASSMCRTAGVKRPLQNFDLDLKDNDLSSAGSVTSGSVMSGSSSSSVSSPMSSGSTAATPKVVVRKREGHAKRTLVRPNSIAFSTYPTFDLGSEGQDSPSSSSSTTSQDDSCETYVQNGKKSKSSEYMTDVRFRLGRYSEREMYRQITAVMETAMLKSQAFEASRKSRSLDDILSSEDDSSAPNCESSMFDRVLRHCAMNRDRYTSPTLLLDNLACVQGHGVNDSYHSNSSLSSAGSHSSLHSSMELIQVS